MMIPDSGLLFLGHPIGIYSSCFVRLYAAEVYAKNLYCVVCV